MTRRYRPCREPNGRAHRPRASRLRLDPVPPEARTPRRSAAWSGVRRRWCRPGTQTSRSLVGAPRVLGDLEVEATRIAEQRDELKASFGVDNLPQRRIDRVPQRRGSENSRRLSCDIPIDLNGCLRHDIHDIHEAPAFTRRACASRPGPASKVARSAASRPAVQPAASLARTTAARDDVGDGGIPCRTYLFSGGWCGVASLRPAAWTTSTGCQPCAQHQRMASPRRRLRAGAEPLGPVHLSASHVTISSSSGPTPPSTAMSEVVISSSVEAL